MSRREHHIADAYHAVGRIDHYMVGVVGDATWEELEGAKQILIRRQNAGRQKGSSYLALERALDEIERRIKTAQ